MDFYSHHDKKHKISTASTPLNRASNLLSTSAGKSKELIYVTNALESNGYPQSFISNIQKKKTPPETTPSREELVGMFFRWADPPNSYRSFAVLPYIKGLTEPLTRLLRNNGIRTTSRPLKTLQQEFVSPKSRPPVPCADCPWSYIGETGRCLKTSVKEHTRNTKAFKKGSNIATHAWLNDHSIDFKSAHVIDKGNFRVRKTLESWPMAITSDADNNAKQLARQYSILL